METHINEGEVRNEALNLLDNLGLRCSIEGLKLDIERSLLLRLLLEDRTNE